MVNLRNYKTEQGMNFPIKIRSRKENSILKRQLEVYLSQIDKYFGLNFENNIVKVKFGYVNNDFAVNKYTLLFIFSPKEQEPE